MKPDPKTFYNERMPQKLGDNYEHARWHSNSFQKAQYAMMQDVMRRVVLCAKNAKRILEVGPGPGTWTEFLLDGNKEAAYTLVDISAEMLQRAQANLPHGFSISYVESDFLQFQSSESFDFIFSSRALEYVSDKPAAVAKIALLLALGGSVAIITKMPKPFLQKVTGTKSSELHSGQIAPAALIRLFQKNGLQVEMLRVATATLPGFKSAFLNTLTYRILSSVPLLSPLSIFAESYVVIAKKPL